MLSLITFMARNLWCDFMHRDHHVLVRARTYSGIVQCKRCGYFHIKHY